MALIKKAEVSAPALQKEEIITVPELGGDVIVRGPGLSERLGMAFSKSPEGRKFAHLAKLLAVCVLDGDYEPLFTVEQWEAFACNDEKLSAAMRLWDIAWRLGDFDGAQAEKNEKAPTSA